MSCNKLIVHNHLRNKYLAFHGDLILKDEDFCPVKERKVKEPLAKEHRRPLDNLSLENLDFNNPEAYARLIDEDLQLMYRAQRARGIQRGMLEVLEERYE